MIHGVKKPVVGPSFLLSQVGAYAARDFAGRLATRDLKPAHAGILRIVGANPGLSQQALSKTLGMFASRLVLLLDELELRHLLERRAKDRRSHGLYLTAGGRRALTAIEKLTQTLEKKLFARLPPRELAQLERTLRLLVTANEITSAVHPAYRELE